MLKFQKFGTLWWYNGLPVYAGGRLLTRRHLCWWWPVNWIAVPLALVVAIGSIATARLCCLARQHKEGS
jgi:hypothetical protein